MSLNPEQVARLAELARIDLDEPEIQAVGRELSGIFTLIDALQRAELDHCAPLAHPLDLAAPLREDLAVATPPAAQWLELAPQAAGDLFLVPRFVE